MVANHKNAHGIADNSKQEMIGEALQIDASKVAFANCEGLRPVGGLLHVTTQFGVKFIGELTRRNPLVVCHDLVDIRKHFRMQDETHQLRRRSIF